ncbi:MAG TPA: EamA family transporter [bacterium]|uniref:Putative DMT superfamily transporter inner membrane protein n=1 Tax=candidate division TA06 bacterium ADurb.Bin417 TaxID=1852828 RepID=A0A1V5M8P5_UNCT6|nr:MAG: putative DMT superfamily transporter inner membrane protein [candidate division TA06 bacterium ADurb.Bin417]HNQ35348.1 EamA family transporter [bacterium]HNS48806.1 EamA family transporter [bacterium]
MKFRSVSGDRAAVLAGIIACLSWGTVFVLGRVAAEADIQPVWLVFLRFIFASLFLALFLTVSRTRIRLERRDLPAFLLLGATGVAGMNLFIFFALRHITATAASILENLNPVFIGLLAPVFLKERLSLRDAAGMAVGLVGCYLVVSQGRVVSFAFLGGLLALLANLCWAFYTLAARRFGVIARYGAPLATFWSAWLGVGFLGLVLLLAGLPEMPGRNGWLLGAYLGVVPAGIGFTLWFFAVQRLSAVQVGVLQYLVPLTTGLIAVFWLGEVLSGWTLAGGLLILAGASLPYLAGAPGPG